MNPAQEASRIPVLLNMLTKNEVLDLVAYVLSGGDAKNAMFK